MVLDLHRHALDRRVVARPLRHRPGLERIADLQAEVVMPARRVVQLHHEDRALAFRQRLARRGLAGLAELPLAPVLDQAHVPTGLFALLVSAVALAGSDLGLRGLAHVSGQAGNARDRPIP